MDDDIKSISPCSRAEAVELAIRTSVVAHLIVCALVVAVMSSMAGASGVLVGLGIAAGLAVAIPFVVIPVAAAIGFLTHLIFRSWELPLPRLIRILVILFELSIFGWVVAIYVAVNS